MQEFYLDSAGALAQFCDSIRHSPWLALDTEFVREKSYWPQLCLLQISDGSRAACIDPLHLDNLDPLAELLLAPTSVKIFHAARQDLEIFNLLWQKLPAPLFDTQLAATLLGLGEQLGYAALVHKLLGIELTKAHTRTDWLQRPLQAGQLRYALDDVIYLGDLYLVLNAQLERMGRKDWLREEFDLLADPDIYQVHPERCWQRIKGRQRLRGVQLAVLQSLAAWREMQAITNDRPRRWIMRDEVLLDLARCMPKNMDETGRIRGLDHATLKHHGTQLVNLIAEARNLPRTSWPTDKPVPTPLNPNQEALVDLLMCSLRILAEENQVSPAVLASRNVLEQLIAGERKLELLQGWRRKLAGEQLLEVIAGHLMPQLIEGRLRLTEVHT
ncbi:MAG: ribonuclease D [Chromatiaceae bacterium]|nr:ribonuclease D [Chromatiaceae bacterium]